MVQTLDPGNNVLSASIRIHAEIKGNHAAECGKVQGGGNTVEDS